MAKKKPKKTNETNETNEKEIANELAKQGFKDDELLTDEEREIRRLLGLGRVHEKNKIR